MFYQRTSGKGRGLKPFLICIATLALSLTSSSGAWGAITNQTSGDLGPYASTGAGLTTAISEANAGDTLYLEVGTYTIDTALDITKALTITGAVESLVVVQLLPVRSDNVFTIDAAGSSVSLQKLTIRFGDYGVYSDAGNVSVTNCTFYLNGYDGTAYDNSPTAANAEASYAANSTDGGAIRIADSTGSEISNCTITQNDAGIVLMDCTSATVSDNTVNDNNQSGIYLASSTGDGDNGCASSTVEDNTCNTNKENGIRCVGGLANTISGNTCTSNWNGGIMLTAPGQVTVENNTFNTNNTYAFNGRGNTGHAGGSVYIVGTTIDANATFAFQLNSNTITNGSAGDQDDAIGINLEAAPDAAITIDGNTLSGMDTDIWVQSQASNTTIVDNSLASTIGVQNDESGVSVTATSNWWGDETGPGGSGSGAGANVSDDVSYDPWWKHAAMRDTVTTFTLRTPTVLGAVEPIKLHLDLSSDWANISSIGTRLTYDSSKITFTSLTTGSGVPSSWTATYSETGTDGEVDVVIKDADATDNISSAPSDLEVLIVTFSRNAEACNDALDFEYNAEAGDGTNMETEGQYLKRVNTQDATVVEATTAENTVSGPTVTDYAFIRGNVNARSSHRLDLADVIDLAAYLYSGLTFSFDCDAAKDVNNDGAEDISDVVTLVQAIFNTSGVTIAAPNFSDPGIGVPGVVSGNGGSISSQLSCAEGETCN